MLWAVFRSCLELQASLRALVLSDECCSMLCRMRINVGLRFQLRARELFIHMARKLYEFPAVTKVDGLPPAPSDS